MMQISASATGNYQQACVGGGFPFLVCEVILVDKSEKPELGLPETWRHPASSELSVTLPQI